MVVMGGQFLKRPPESRPAQREAHMATPALTNGVHVGPHLPDGSHGQFSLRQIVPPRGAGVSQGLANDTFQAFVHAAI